MPGTIVNQGEAIMLEALISKTAPQSLVLRLFTNNVTPSIGDTEGSYTEAAGNGYSAAPLTASSWTTSGTAPTQVQYPQVTFTFSGPVGNVYGYYLTQGVSGKLVAAERFANGPYNIQNDGDQIKVTPTITSSNVG
jgi:hypothetical protein